MAKAKKQDNLRKLLRMHCPHCTAEQESIRVQCKQCGKDLHPEVDSEILAAVNGDIKAYEEAFKEAQDPKGNPYHPIDKAINSLKRLYKHRSFPGIDKYVEAAGKQLLPFRLQLMKRTLTANMVLLMILAMFALLPIMIGWPLMIAGVMALPVIGWGVIAFKAYRQYADVKKQVDALDPA